MNSEMSAIAWASRTRRKIREPFASVSPSPAEQGRNSQSTFRARNSLKIHDGIQARAERPGACGMRKSHVTFRRRAAAEPCAIRVPRNACVLERLPVTACRVEARLNHGKQIAGQTTTRHGADLAQRAGPGTNFRPPAYVQVERQGACALGEPCAPWGTHEAEHDGK